MAPRRPLGAERARAAAFRIGIGAKARIGQVGEWLERSRAVFDASMAALAERLARAAVDREPLPDGGMLGRLRDAGAALGALLIAGAFTLELAGLERVDQSGIELLRALMGTGASLRGMNPYMALLLQGSGDLA